MTSIYDAYATFHCHAHVMGHDTYLETCLLCHDNIIRFFRRFRAPKCIFTLAGIDTSGQVSLFVSKYVSAPHFIVLGMLTNKVFP